MKYCKFGKSCCCHHSLFCLCSARLERLSAEKLEKMKDEALGDYFSVLNPTSHAAFKIDALYDNLTSFRQVERSGKQYSGKLWHVSR